MKKRFNKMNSLKIYINTLDIFAILTEKEILNYLKSKHSFSSIELK